LFERDQHQIEEEFSQRAMQNVWFAYEFVYGSVEAIGELPVDMGVILEQKQIKLNLSLDVFGCMHDLVDQFYFRAN
jgi:hypothetical protein